MTLEIIRQRQALINKMVELNQAMSSNERLFKDLDEKHYKFNCSVHELEFKLLIDELANTITE